MSNLHCTQEEADGRLMLHTLHVSNYDRLPVVIAAEDTDGFILALSEHNLIAVPYLGRTSENSLIFIRQLE